MMNSIEFEHDSNMKTLGTIMTVAELSICKEQ
jgi:hypothetical protein